MKPAKNHSPNRWRGFAAAAGLGLAVAGCAGTSDTGPAALSGGAVDTGTYPNLNVPPPVATQPFDPASLGAQNEALRAARAGQAAQGRDAAALAAAGRAEQARLRKLARSHQADALKAIETAR